jgi:hypothetical protein
MGHDRSLSLYRRVVVRVKQPWRKGLDMSLVIPHCILYAYEDIEQPDEGVDAGS